jgi:hypothetical protein
MLRHDDICNYVGEVNGDVVETIPKPFIDTTAFEQNKINYL